MEGSSWNFTNVNDEKMNLIVKNQKMKKKFLKKKICYPAGQFYISVSARAKIAFFGDFSPFSNSE